MQRPFLGRAVGSLPPTSRALPIRTPDSQQELYAPHRVFDLGVVEIANECKPDPLGRSERTALRTRRLDVLLGVGGMAAVYAATHRNGTRAAIKVLHPELSTHGHVRARFVREGYVANRIEHSGVVRVIDDDVAEDGSLFLVMELLDGESLEERRVRLGGILHVDEALAVIDVNYSFPWTTIRIAARLQG